MGRAPAPPAELAVPSDSRHIPAAFKRAVWQADEGRCAYRDPRTAKRCNSSHALQIDHKRPWAKAGKTEPSNLRLLCRKHNLHAAIQAYGPKKIRAHLAHRDPG